VESKKQAYFFNETRKTMVASKVIMADSFLSRIQGLLWRDRLNRGEGLLLRPCNSIHMFGMRYPIDAVFLDKAGSVVGLIENIKPWRVSAVFFKATACLELPAGTISSTGTTVGDKLTISSEQPN